MHRLPHDPHGYHERSGNEFGLQMDSTEELLRSPIRANSSHKSMKIGVLGVVARDGIEPPTPAFSGPLSQRSNMFRIRVSSRVQNG